MRQFSTFIVSGLIALGSATVPSALAGQLPNAVAIASGAAIQVPQSEGIMTCTIAVISEREAVTAGHCGEEGAPVFFDSVPIGYIDTNYLTVNRGADVATITLNDRVAVVPDSLDTGWQPRNGDQLVARGAISGEVRGEVIDAAVSNRASTIAGGSYPARTITTAMALGRGDSGAPVYHDGFLVGLVHGGNAADITTVSTLDVLYSG